MDDRLRDERLRVSDPTANWRSAPIDWKFLTPLIWAPVFPTIRHSLRYFPKARSYIFGGAIVLANMHGFWLINNPDLTDLDD